MKLSDIEGFCDKLGQEPRRSRRSGWFMALGTLSVFFLFGTIMVVPWYDGKSGLDIISDLIGGVEKQTDVVGATGDYPELDGWEYATGTTSTTVVVNKPSDTSENDLLVAFVGTDGVEDIYSPSGWTGIAHVESDACSLASYYKIATSSEPSDYTFGWGTSEDAVGSILRITGAHTSTPIHVNTTAFESGTNQPVIAPTITTSVDNCLILRAHVLDDNDEGDDYDGYPASHIGVLAKTDVTCSHSVAYENLSGQGSAGTAQWTFENAEEFVTFSIAIQPASATLPTQSSESPVNGSVSVAVLPSLYVVCNDINNETMRAIWRSNSSGSWVTFASNTSISSGTNITQTNSNFSSGSENYSWSVCLTDDYSDTSWTNNTYWLNTALSIPEIQLISPVNGSTGISTTPTVQIKPWDNGSVAEDFTVEWWDNATGGNLTDTFGYETSSTTDSGIEDIVRTSRFQTGASNSVAQNIIVSLYNPSNKIKCAIYDNSKNLVSNGETVEQDGVFDNIGPGTWYRFNFTGTKPSLTANSYYYLAVWGDTFGVDVDYVSGVGTGKFSHNEVYDSSFPSVIDTNTSAGHEDDYLSIYCTYEYHDDDTFALQQTNASISSGTQTEWTYTNASTPSTKYWWKVIVNNSEQTNGSVDWYKFTTTSGVGETWQTIEEWNLTISDTSVDQTISEWNLTISDTSAFQQISEWNLTISDTSADQTISEWNLTISNTSVDQTIAEWNLTISDTSLNQTIQEWNLTISDTSVDQTIVEWNLTISDTSLNQTISEWNLTISNTTGVDWNQIAEWNLTISDSSADQQISEWNLTISDTSINQTIIEWNLTISDTSLNQTIDEWNLTISNTTGVDWNQIQEWNLTISNTSIPADLTITNIHPVNESSIPYVTPALCFNITSSTGLDMNYTIRWSLDTSLSEILMSTTVAQSNGTFCHLFSNASGYVTHYWSVNLTDSDNNRVNETYEYTSRHERGSTGGGMGLVPSIFAIGMTTYILILFFVFIKKKNKKNKRK